MAHGIRPSVFLRVFSGLAIIAILIVGAGILSIKSFREFNQGVRSFSAQDMPTVIDGSKLNHLSATLASFAPALITAETTGTRNSIFLRIKDQDIWLDEILAGLAARDIDKSELEAFKALKDNLIINLQHISELVQTRNSLLDRSAKLLNTLPSLNSKSFNLSQQYDAKTPEITQALQEWHQRNSEMLLLLTLAATIDQRLELEKLVTQYHSSKGISGNILSLLPEQIVAEITHFEQELNNLAVADNGIFQIYLSAFDIEGRIQGTLSQNKLIANRFVAASSVLSRNIRDEILQKSELLDQTTQARGLYLLILTLLCLFGAVLVFLYINKSVIRRIGRLQQGMLKYAEGHEAPIDTLGNDEISDMAKTFQFFVRTIQEREDALQDANSQIAEAQARLLDAIQNMSEGFVLFDNQQKIILSNDKYHQLYDGEAPKSPLNGSKEVRTKHGKWLLVQEHRTKSGGLLGIHADITDKKAAEADLRLAKETAEHADRAKSLFLAAASHDLRQPLHAVGLFAASLTDRAKDPDIQDIAHHMERSILHMDDLFESILNFSQLEVGDLKPDISAVPLSTIFDNLARDFSILAQEKSLTLRLVKSSAIVRSDALMLDRILRNLVSNAIRYTEKGRILIGSRRKGQNIRIDIWDTGKGISEDQQKKIFGVFYRGDDSRSDDRGLGLGLSIAAQMAQLLESQIEIQSAPGQGSRFSVTIPLISKISTHPPDPIPQRGVSSISNASLRGMQILVIDDDPQILKATKSLLSRWECDITTAQTQKEADAILRQRGGAFLAILVDYQMDSAISGLEFMSGYSDFKGKTILITGNTDPAIGEKARAAGFHLFQKPLKPAKLASLLRHLKRDHPNPD